MTSSPRNRGLLFCLLLYFPVRGQEMLSKPHGCPVYAETGGEELWAFKPEESVEARIDEIHSGLAVRRNFRVKAANIPLAASVIDSGQRLLLYNTAAFQKLGENTDSGWSLRLALSHGIAHHVLRHEWRGDSAQLEREEQAADSLAGRILFSMGFRTGKHKAALESAFRPHPERKRLVRNRSFIKGWEAVRKQIPTTASIRYASHKDVDNIPRFPWPPPEASAFIRVPLKRSGGGGLSTLGEAATRLENALQSAGYAELSYYQVPNGFALVTRLEQFNEDGTSKDPGRWADSVKARIFSFTDYIKTLFTASEGRFRVIVFIISDAPFTQTEDVVTDTEAKGWLKKGLNDLPKEIRDLPHTSQHKCTAMIYEFMKSDVKKHPVVVSRSALNGLNHLDGARLWAPLQ